MTAPAFVAVLGRGPLPPHSPVFRTDDPGALRGDGCFETLRVAFTPGQTPSFQVDTPERHWTRLHNSLLRLDLSHVNVPEVAAWFTAMCAACARTWDEPGAAQARLTVTRGAPDAAPTVALRITPEAASNPAQREGVHVAALSMGRPAWAHRDAPWLLGGVKSLSYAVNSACVREAHRRGADDALMISTDGFVLEAAMAGVIVLRDTTLLATPVAGTGILDSTTIADLFAQIDANPAVGLTTQRALTRLEDLPQRGGTWLVSSVRGVCPVLSVDGRSIPTSPDVTTTLNSLGGWAH